MNQIESIYEKLMKMYGPQGWWPLLELDNTKRIHHTKSGSVKGYHHGDYSYPKTKNQKLEICIGSIATQNTNWLSVEKALINLKKLNALSPKALNHLDIDKLKDAIKPAGYFNQKAKKIKIFTEFFLSLNDRTPSRKELLDIWGIGPETADSMLLYAFKVPSFVVDAYTRRIMINCGFIDEKAGYDEIKALFEDNLKPSLIVYQEYHALLVEHAKRYYSKKLEYAKCPLYRRFN